MRALVLTLFLALAASGAQAATLDVIGGQLRGASNVDVGGLLYDVEFVEGSCIGVFDGCDDPSDFAFTDLASGNLASQALLDQVFLDGSEGSFDSSPGLTLGCEGTEVCGAMTPFDGDASSATVFLSASIAINKDISRDFVDFLGMPYGIDSVGELLGGQAQLDTADALTSAGPVDVLVWARWQAAPIPEPNTAILLGLGLVALGRFRQN